MYRRKGNRRSNKGNVDRAPGGLGDEVAPASHAGWDQSATQGRAGQLLKGLVYSRKDSQLRKCKRRAASATEPDNDGYTVNVRAT